MKRYKIDLSAEEFFDMVRSGAIDKETDFEAYDVAEPEPMLPKMKLPAAKPRKARRTKAQIMADKAEEQKAHKSGSLPDEPMTTQRAFPWEDESMNTAAE